MKTVVLLVVLVGVALVVAGVLIRVVLAKHEVRRRARSPWEIAEESDGEQVRVVATKPDADPLLIGAVAFAAGDFDQQLYVLRSEGREKVYALNEKGAL